MRKPANEKIDNYDEDVQKLYITFMLRDAVGFALSQNIIKPDYFEDFLKPTVRFIMAHADEYKILPTPAQVQATTKYEVLNIDEPEVVNQRQWFLDAIEGFCRHKALELIVLDGLDLIQNGHYGEIETRVKDAMTISLLRDLGTDYFADPKGRLTEMRNSNHNISTGWKVLDAKLGGANFGGFSPGTLNVFAGGSGSGKSLFLQNLALNYVMGGYNVVYFTLELSADLVSMRIDAMISAVPPKDIFRRLDEVDLKVRMTGKHHQGKLRIKKMPESGTTANDLRAYLKEYEIQFGVKPEVIIVDYLDLMHSNNARIDPSDLFVKDKYTSEELRAMADEWHAIGITASQLNRSSVEAENFNHSHIAGGISKINTADNVFAIATSLAMRERGEYGLQFLKTRSSAAVGQTITLKYDPGSLRISDPDPEDATKIKPAATIGAEIKKKLAAAETPPEEADKKKPEVAPKDLLARIRRT